MASIMDRRNGGGGLQPHRALFASTVGRNHPYGIDRQRSHRNRRLFFHFGCGGLVARLHLVLGLHIRDLHRRLRLERRLACDFNAMTQMRRQVLRPRPRRALSFLRGTLGFTSGACVNRPFSLAGAHDGVQFINE